MEHLGLRCEVVGLGGFQLYFGTARLFRLWDRTSTVHSLKDQTAEMRCGEHSGVPASESNLLHLKVSPEARPKKG